MIDTDFFDTLCPRDTAFEPSLATTEDRLADGTVIASAIGAALWRVSARMPQMPVAQYRAVQARLVRLQQPGNFVMAWDVSAHGPASDRGGVILGSATPVVQAVDADAARLRVSGLPAGYVLSAGDWIGWTYASSPVRYALHQLVTGAVADGTGLTPLFEVQPHIRAMPNGTGLAGLVGAPVSLVRPRAKFRVTGVTWPERSGPVQRGLSIQMIQTLR